MSLSKILKIYVGGTLAAIIIRVLDATLRWHRINLDPEKDPPFRDCEQAIFAFWHGRMLMAEGVRRHIKRSRRGRKLYMLISQHGDGRLIAFAVKLLGISSVAGSSSKGGAAGLAQMVEVAKAGHDLGITPDGPRGPRYESKMGAVVLAKRTGLPIYPFSYSAKSRWQLGSWDGMIIPKPFSKAIAILGEPILVPADASEEELIKYRVQLDEKLQMLTDHADSHDYRA